MIMRSMIRLEDCDYFSLRLQKFEVLKAQIQEFQPYYNIFVWFKYYNIIKLEW